MIWTRCTQLSGRPRLVTLRVRCLYPQRRRPDEALPTRLGRAMTCSATGGADDHLLFAHETGTTAARHSAITLRSRLSTPQDRPRPAKGMAWRKTRIAPVSGYL